MALLLFPESAAVGRVLVPLMLYHPLQLIVGSVLATRWAGEATAS
jgi:sodium/bile acid cotransporter 7